MIDEQRALWRALSRWRHPLLLLLVLQQTWASRMPTDWWLLTTGARALTGPQPFSVYVDTPYLQAGPTGLLVVRALDLLPANLGEVAAHLGLAVLGWGLLWLVERRVHPDGVPIQEGLLTLAVGLPVLAIWSFLAGGAPHPEDGLAIATFVFAALAVRHQRSTVAGLLIGLALSWKPWAVVALPMVLGLRGGRTRASALAIAIPAMCWLPFLLADSQTLRSVSHGFELQHNAALRAFGFGSDHVPLWWRSVELAGTLIAALLAAVRRSWLVAIAAGCTARLLLDPAGFDYYVAGVVLVTALTERLAGLPPWRTALLASGFVYAQVLIPTSATASVRAAVLGLVLVSWLIPPGREVIETTEETETMAEDVRPRALRVAEPLAQG